MLTVFGFHQGDRDQCLRMLEWMKQIGIEKKHPCLIVVAHNTTLDGIKEAASEVFTEVNAIHPDDDINGWPQGANSLWSAAVHHLHKKIPHWLWIEPDCVFLKATAIDDIEAEHVKQGKPFSGDPVHVSGVVPHMSGVAVYPGNTMDYTENLWRLSGMAWDVFLAPEFMPRMARNKHIQHLFWQSRSPDVSPTFPDKESLSIIRPDAAIFHRCKDGTLQDRLRENLGVTSERGEPVTAVVGNVPSIPEIPAHSTHAHTPSEIHKFCMGQPSEIKPETISEKFRKLIDEMEKVIDGKTGRKMLLLNELRDRGLAPQARKRK